jgi:hypothetical protein
MQQRFNSVAAPHSEPRSAAGMTFVLLKTSIAGAKQRWQIAHGEITKPSPPPAIWRPRGTAGRAAPAAVQIKSETRIRDRTGHSPAPTPATRKVRPNNIALAGFEQAELGDDCITLSSVTSM